LRTPGSPSPLLGPVRALHGLPGLPAQPHPRALHGSRDTTDAVVFGVGSTARLITGAALIIIAVFAGFAAGSLVCFQQMGFGVAVALLIDATIVRSAVISSAMTLLGHRNWQLPPQPAGCRGRRSKTRASHLSRDR
jgi:uncharacterized membrane protein YdfJ with MMPL/SSD domain